MGLITEFYKGKTIFVTGATGYMGKVLLEKLIRTIPDLRKIYVLLRPKKGVSPEERVKQLTNSLIFTFNNIDQKSLDKIAAVSGDITKENFQLNENDQQKLIDEVSIVFHIAASVRMNLPLKEAVITNTKSTYQLYQFCMKIKNLVSVVHLSTAYCNVDITYMEEKVYPLNISPYKIIDMVEWMDDKSLAAVENNIIHPHPNTYTFTKRLSEMVTQDMGSKLPIIIVRPSIVIPGLYEPIPGWVDNYNGPVGIALAILKGVLRSPLIDPNALPQIVPVDVAINCLIISGYERASGSYSDTPVINSTQGQMCKITSGEIIRQFLTLTHKYPYKWFMWYPDPNYTQNYYVYICNMILFHFIPALVIDILLIVFFQKPFFFSTQRRIFAASKALSYFTNGKWNFTAARHLKISKKLTPEDNKIFYGLTDVELNIKNYMAEIFFCTRKYLMKEGLENIGICKLQLKILYVLSISAKFLFYFLLIKMTWYLVEYCYGGNIFNL